MQELSFVLRTSPEAVIAAARTRIQNNNGTLTGDTSSGSFKVKGVEGDYTIDDGTLVITITKKPFFIPDSVITKLVNDQFEDICNNAD